MPVMSRYTLMTQMHEVEIRRWASQSSVRKTIIYDITICRKMEWRFMLISHQAHKKVV